MLLELFPDVKQVGILYCSAEANSLYQVQLFSEALEADGIAYKALTKQKLTFGITLSCAFCGVPNIYTTRKTSLIALLSPFIVFTIVLGVLVILLPNDITGLYASILFAIHVGGCIGDLYCTWLLLFKLPKETIINDTGPKQTFYSKITN